MCDFSGKMFKMQRRIHNRRQAEAPGFGPEQLDSSSTWSSMRQGISFPTASENRSSNPDGMFGCFLIRRVNDNLPLFARAFALAADAGLFLQNEMQDATFTRRHGVEAKRRVRFADAASRNASGKF